MTSPLQSATAPALLTALDDFCVHQSANVVRRPVSDSPNVYDRYFANGFARDGSYYFALSLGRFANRQVMDAAVTFQVGGVHHSFFASRRDPEDPTEMQFGPLSLTIVRPMREMRVRLDANDSGLSCDLLFMARSAPVLESRSTSEVGDRLAMDLTRWTQFGCWTGWFEVDGHRTIITPAVCAGVKDRSWGQRDYGMSDEAKVGAGSRQSSFWNWIPLQFDDFAIHSLRFEKGDSNKVLQESFYVPLAQNGEDVVINDTRIVRSDSWRHDYQVDAPRRQIIGGSFTIDPEPGGARSRRIEIGEPLLTAWPYAIGYHHPVWRHGKWHGELATGHERWNVDEADMTNEAFVLMHRIVNVRCEGKSGFGFIEQSISGSYTRYGIE